MRVSSRGILLGFVLLATLAGLAPAERASFSGPPELETRKITWRWEPLPGKDPFYEGNTILDSIRVVNGPQPGKALRMLRASREGRVLYGVYTGESRIYIWSAENGAVERVLEAPPDTLLDFDVHGTGLLILGGLADGRIASWDLRTGNTPEIFTGHASRCWKVQFLGPGLTANDRGFASAADVPSDPRLKIWTSPGAILTSLSVPQPLTTLDGTSDGNTILAGDGSGNLRVFTYTFGQWTIAPDRPTGHLARIVGVQFCADRTRAFSIDASGKLLGWSPGRWTKNLEVQLDRVDGAALGVRDPDGALVYTLDQTGYFQIFDGEDGRQYRGASLSGNTAIDGSAFADLGRLIYVGMPDGVVRTYRTGFCLPSDANPECFGGYKIWRSPTPRAEDAMLLKTYGFGDSTWSFVDSVRIFVDPDSMIKRGEHDPDSQDELLAGPHNGFPYYYSITDFWRRYENGSVFEVGWDPASIQQGFFRLDPSGDPVPVETHAPAWPDSEPPILSHVIVVPNPYEAGKVPWDAQGGEHVDFLNLPQQATIRLYTTAGDHLRTIEHGKGEFGESSGRESWDLKNQQGERVASGVYIFHISSTLTAEEAKGYFIVVR
jgi:WD40 repeat protein